MRLVIIAVLSTALALPAGAVSKGKECRQACSALIATCTKSTAAAGFGNLTTACKRAVLKRCRREGPAVCGTFCGNGAVEGAEACDGGDLGGATCASMGCGSGRLACTAGCGLDTSGCVPSLVAAACGNSVLDAPEQCDGAALGGATCASLGFTRGGMLGCTAGCGYDVSGCRSQKFLATGQMTCSNSGGNVIPCAGTGHDGDLQKGAALAYVDNGDGTITDMNTGLMWEKQSRDGTIHDLDNLYTWANAFATKIATLNTMRFAGHADWRVPNLNELESIRNLKEAGPAVSAVFHTQCSGGCTVLTCSCTRSANYWSSSTYANNPANAWNVNFPAGNVFSFDKTVSFAVRGVRGGS